MQLAEYTSGAMTDLASHEDGIDAPFPPQNAIQRCTRTDDFLQHLSHNRGPLRLSRNEYRLLSVLVQSEGKILTPEDLMATAFGEHFKRCTNYVRMYISLMRKRLEPDPKNPIHIVTEYNRGYRFRF